MDPASLAALGSLSGLLGKGGGGGTKVSQSLSNNASVIINSLVQGMGSSPSTGAVTAPLTSNPSSSASGADSVPDYSSAALGNDAMGLGAGDSVAPTSTGFTMNQNVMYGIGAIVLGLVGFFIWKKK